MTQIPFEQLLVLWDDGERQLRAAEPRERRVIDAVVEAVTGELRRRIGARFTTDQLAALYMEGNDWCFDFATRLAPDTPAAWDMQTVVGAAYNRLVRRATDFGGGRRRLEEAEEA